MKQKELDNFFSDLFYSEKPALLYKSEEITYSSLFAKSLALANGFKNKGLKVGDKITVQLDNSPEFIFCYFAALFGGFIIIPLDSSLGKKDYDYIINITDPKLIIEKKDQLNYINGQDYFFQTNIDSTYAIFFTSGTTGQPKGVCHSVGSLFGNAVAFNKFVGFDSSVRMMHIMPMGYMAGFLNTLLCPIVAGGSVSIAPRFNFSNVFGFWNTAINHNVNSVWFSPTMISLLSRFTRGMNEINWVRENMKYIFVGTAPLLEQIDKQFQERFGLKCLESYGMTEALIISTNIPSGDTEPRSVGKPIHGVELKLEKVNKTNINENKIYVKSNYMFKEYLFENQTIGIKDEWFPSGDLGFIDDKDNLFITGREKDLIIHGGMNVSPVTVQDCLLEMQHIDEVVVIGRPHDFWGEEIVAFVKMLNGKGMYEEKLVSHCKKRLNPDAIPSQFIEVSAIPRSSTGKPQKHKLFSML